MYRLNNKYLVVKSALVLFFVWLAYKVFTFINVQTDLAKISLAFLGIVVMALSVALIVEYIVKTLWLERESKVKRFSAIISLNGFAGLVFPLFVFNLALNKVIYYFAITKHANTLFCDLRWSLINFYNANSVYMSIYNLIGLIIVILIAAFIFGAIFEKLKR